MRAVEQARAGQARAVLLERVARAGDDARVVGQPEVVVGAEHDPLGALHLDDGAGGRLERAEVGQQVRLAGGPELFGALVAAHLAEDVDGRRHVACPPPWGRSRSGRSILRATSVASSAAFRLYRDEPNWVPPLLLRAPPVPRPAQEPVLRARPGGVLPRAARGARGRPHHAPRSTTTSRRSRRTAGAGSASSSARTTRRPPRRCSTAPSSGCAGRAATAWSGPPTSRPTTSAAC